MLINLKKYLYAFFAMLFAGLGAFAVYEKKRADIAEDEAEEIKKQMELQGHNDKVKEFQAINNERKEVTDEAMVNTNQLDSSTTYEL